MRTQIVRTVAPVTEQRIYPARGTAVASELATMRDAQDRALHELEAFAFELAAGRSPRASITSTLSELRVGTARGDGLLRIMLATSPRLDESPVARRRFFHAARAFLSLRRDSRAA